MSESVIEVHLPDSVMQGAADEAARNGVSVESWLRRLVEQRVRETYITEKYFARQSQPGDVARMLEILRFVPDNPPVEGDELPEDLSPRQDRLRNS